MAKGIEVIIAMTSPMTFLGLILVATGAHFWDQEPARQTKQIGTEARCALISRALDFKVEIHPGWFQVPYSQDQSVRQSAYWRGKPLVCASVEEKTGTKRTPLFSAGETCGTEVSFFLYGQEAFAAKDLPARCVDAGFRRLAPGRYRFTLMLAGTKEVIGSGLYPVKGIAKRNGDEWILRQLFRPVPEGK